MKKADRNFEGGRDKSSGSEVEMKKGREGGGEER
jgi:hypothetical protein